eukprot:TRINITY_DN844_c0_g1_i13.p1 TRINITY_DN844_c0_g1~~TRINITY_DN844_c0_g1_i13.p1  ORF type:complete len:501 (+),score=74.34 TRINITY_DN844_c0_g1_i13:209-1711(+)
MDESRRISDGYYGNSSNQGNNIFGQTEERNRRGSNSFQSNSSTQGNNIFGQTEERNRRGSNSFQSNSSTQGNNIFGQTEERSRRGNNSFQGNNMFGQTEDRSRRGSGSLGFIEYGSRSADERIQISSLNQPVQSGGFSSQQRRSQVQGLIQPVQSQGFSSQQRRSQVEGQHRDVYNALQGLRLSSQDCEDIRDQSYRPISNAYIGRSNRSFNPHGSSNVWNGQQRASGSGQFFNEVQNTSIQSSNSNSFDLFRGEIGNSFQGATVEDVESEQFQAQSRELKADSNDSSGTQGFEKVSPKQMSSSLRQLNMEVMKSVKSRIGNQEPFEKVKRTLQQFYRKEIEAKKLLRVFKLHGLLDLLPRFAQLMYDIKLRQNLLDELTSLLQEYSFWESLDEGTKKRFGVWQSAFDQVRLAEQQYSWQCTGCKLLNSHEEDCCDQCQSYRAQPVVRASDIKLDDVLDDNDLGLGITKKYGRGSTVNQGYRGSNTFRSWGRGRGRYRGR